MKKTLFKTILTALCVVLSTSADAVSTGKTFDVNVTVVNACTISVTGITFPDWDGTATIWSPGDVTVTCPSPVSYEIALGPGLHSSDYQGYTVRYMADNNNNLLLYGLYQTNDTSMYWSDMGYGTMNWGTTFSDVGNNSPQPHAVYGAIGTLLNEGATAGVYSDTVNATVYW